MGFNPPQGATTSETAGATLLSDWDDRPSGPADGDAVVFMGLTFKWLADPGCWVPGVAYDDTPTDVNFIDGDESQVVLEARGWTFTESNDGSVTYDATGRIQFDSAGADANQAFAITSFSGRSQWYWAMFRAKILTAPTGTTSGTCNSQSSVHFDITDYDDTVTTVRAAQFTLQGNAHASNHPYACWHNNGIASANMQQSYLQSSPTTEAMYVLFYACRTELSNSQSVGVAYHETLGLLHTQDSNTINTISGTDRILLGAPTAGDSAKSEWRNFSCGRFMP